RRSAHRACWAPARFEGAAPPDEQAAVHEISTAAVPAMISRARAAERAMPTIMPDQAPPPEKHPRLGRIHPKGRAALNRLVCFTRLPRPIPPAGSLLG